MAMRAKNVVLKMNNGDIFYVAQEELQVGGIAQDPVSLVGNYARGSRGPLLHVYTAINNGGTEAWVNAKLVSSITVVYG
jgi:hypothetical protein